ncbi:MAG: aminotransferase class V-fold PLP-dependent enzyme [Chloroflexi bacterium]|nr:aminotransferase class V-fold PLP-dependent enzyme [Chloroflexota bacterium]
MTVSKLDLYDELGLRRVINASATLTRLGGSIMPAPVIEAMVRASRSFIDVPALQAAAGQRVARMTRNEAAYICNGAAAGLTLSTAACITGANPALIARLPNDLTRLKNEIVVHRCQRNGYDHAVRQTGVRLVEIGLRGSTYAWELEAALSERTAAVVYFAGYYFEQGALPLARVIEIAHARSVPVIVDGAAQIPPVSNLWAYTEAGADLAVFSGGKGLRGPQSSGLIVGRADLIEGVRLNGPPNNGIGRPMKVGKEEIAGIVAAVEWYLGLDEPALIARYERQVARVVETMRTVRGVFARRDFPSEAGQPTPRAQIEIDADVAGIDRDTLVARLREGNPYVEVSPSGRDGIYVNPQTLEEGEEAIVIDRLLQAFATGARS